MLKQELKILTNEVKSNAAKSGILATHSLVIFFCIVSKMILIQRFVMEFVECTPCVGHKNMPVYISACLSVVPFPLLFSLSFSYYI